MTELSDYEYLRPLGRRGHFGAVYLARNRLSGQPVAIKHIDRSKISLSLEAWSAEAAAMAACTHHNLVKILHAEVTVDGPALVMEYLPDGSSESRWALEPAPVGEAVSAAIDICWGLHHLHLRDLTHRDIKPGNILFRGQQAVLGDFGLAAPSGAPVSMMYVAHTPPEVRRGAQWTAGADVFALGVTTYRLVCGDTFCGYDSPGISDLLDRDAWPDRGLWPEHVHKRLRTTLRAAMHPDPAKRPASAADLRDWLEKAQPMVSLRPHGPDNWVAEGGEVCWRISIVGPSHSKSIHVVRDLGKGPRRVRLSGAYGLSEAAALKRVRALLELLATTGKPVK